jgi:hypothetical protein
LKKLHIYRKAEIREIIRGRTIGCFTFSAILIIDKKVVNIGEQQYFIKSSDLLETIVVGTSCILRTSTPVTIRIPEKAYSVYGIPEQIRKKIFYFGVQIFLTTFSSG